MKIHFYLIKLIFLLEITFSYECILTPEHGKKVVILKYFNSFDQLNFNNCNLISIHGLRIVPKEKLILNKSLNFNNITLLSIYQPLVVDLRKLNGIDIISNPFDTVSVLYKLTKQTTDINFFLSDYNFNFYYNGTLITQETCNYDLIRNLTKKSFFSLIPSFDASSPLVLYPKSTCPLVFHNSIIYFLYLASTKNLIVENLLSFSNVSTKLGEKLNAQIFYLELRLYHINLDLSLLNQYVYKKLILLRLSGIIKSIDSDLFKYFKYLKMLHIQTQNIKHLFQKNNWLQKLNFNTFLTSEEIESKKFQFKDIFSLIIDQMHPNVTFYSFPDEDFCYFNNFPHHKLVIPLFRPIIQMKNISCTFEFLMLLSKDYFTDIARYFTSLSPNNYESYYSDEMKLYLKLGPLSTECEEFIKKTSRYCNTEKAKLSEETRTYFYLFDFNFINKMNTFLFSVLLIPIFTLICLVLEIIVVIILSNKNLIKSRVYVYLKLNSYFLILYLLLSQMSLFQLCISHAVWNDAHIGIEFCIENSDNDMFHYLKAILIKMIGNTIKTASNLFYFCFTLKRYVNTTGTRNNYLKMYSNISVGINILIIILMSFLINIHTLFQYSLKKIDVNNQVFDIYDTIRLYSTQNDINDYAQDLNESVSLVLVILNGIKIVFTDIFFLFIGLYIDFKLFLFIKKKNKNVEKNIRLIMNRLKKIKKQRHEKESQNRLNAMIILNGLNFFIFRIPMLIVSFYGFVFKYDLKLGKHFPNPYLYSICRTGQFCKNVFDMSHFIYLNSLIIQFFIFLKLDKNFKEIFDSIFNRNLFKSSRVSFFNFFIK